MAGRLLFVILMYSFHEILQALLQPKLTVNPSVITETDSVTLNCQTPSSVLVSQCYFYTLSGGTVNSFSCRQTLTGTELLLLVHQSSPAEVKVKCFYTVKYGEKNSPSPHSDKSSITIQQTDTSMTPMNPESGDEITGLGASTPGTKDSSNPATPWKTASESRIWKFVAVVAGCGATVGLCILLVSAFLWNKSRTGPEEVKSWRESQNENLDTYHLYSTIAEESVASALKGVEYNTVQLH